MWEALLHGPGGFVKPVALKMLRAEKAGQRDDRAQLLREARTGARLQHPNVVSTLLVSEHDGVLCIALELVRGRSAWDLFHATGPLPARALLDLGVQAAEALHHVHTFRSEGQPAGLVHRDVKPANLLVDRLGTVKLADLGISLAQGTTGVRSGTPGYLPPEQLEGLAEPRSDLFALGVTLYVLGTGSMPLGRGNESLEAIYAVEQRLRAPRFLAPLDQVVPGLGDVVRGCLRRDPAQRHRDAAALAAALAALRMQAPPGPTLGMLVGSAAPELAGEPTHSDHTVALIAGNLRPQRDAFVGREDELRSLGARVRAHPWVVLQGPGGMGKTRLALQLAHQLQRELPGGAWAFDLTEARSVDGIVAAVAGALGVPLDPRDPVGQLGRLLASQGPCLVLLDNLEQCVQALPDTLGVWRELAPEAHFLGTTRIRPGLPDESVLPLGELAPDDAERLFVARAPRALSDEELALVPGLCADLEKVPLSLELAAARLRMLAVPAIRQRLSNALLARGGPERPARHRSVQASLDWSWELLGASAATALCQLSVFEGGFDLAAAEAVLDLGPDGVWALDVLEELADASLIRVDPRSGRFAMWSVVRAFAATRLDEAGRLATELRHGEHYAHMGPVAAVDLDNVVAACVRATARGDGPTATAALEAAGTLFDQQGPCGRWVELAEAVVALPLVGATKARATGLLGRAYWGASSLPEASSCLEDALALVPAGDPGLRAWVELSLGNVCFARGRLDAAQKHVESALATSRALGDREQEGRALGSLGMVEVRRSHLDAARRHIERSLAVHRESGNRRYEGHQLGNLGLVAGMQGRTAEARRCFERALDLHRRLGDRRAEAIALTNLGALLADTGEDEVALRTLEAARTVQRVVGNRRVDGVLLHNLGNVHLRHGRLAEARTCHEEALAVHREVGSRGFEGVALGSLGDLLVAEGKPEAARASYAASLRILAEVGDAAHEGRVEGMLARLEARAGELDRARRRADRGLALLRAAEDQELLAEGLAAWAEVRAALGDRAAAERALEEASTLAPASHPHVAAAIAAARRRSSGSDGVS